jgi:chromosome partitioning protein
MIVALLNQQSGVGKTTLALHLAGVWACQGRRVAVIDADPDACAVEWSERRAQETVPSRFTVTAFARDALHRKLPPVARDVDRVIVDGPSHIEAITRYALMAADFALVPVQPPPFQGLAFVETLRLANGVMTVRPQLRIRFVLNRCNARASVTRDLTQSLADYDPPALTSSITERPVFAEAMESSRLAFELPHSMAAVQEITALAAEVERILS